MHHQLPEEKLYNVDIIEPMHKHLKNKMEYQRERETVVTAKYLKGEAMM